MYYNDQDYKQKQQDAEVSYQQDRWEAGYQDALDHKWNCCQTKTESCSLYCKYLAGHHWGLEQATMHYHVECISNLATLDSEYYDEF